MDYFKSAASLLALVGACTAMAQEPTVSTSMDLRLESNYIWRGIEVYRNPTLQHGIEVGVDAFTLGRWSLIDWTGSGEMIVKEHDFYAYYSFESSELEVSPFYYHFSYPNEVFDVTTEVGVTLDRPLGERDLGLELGFDFDAASGGIYAGVSPSKSCEAKGTTHDLTATAGFMNAANNNYNFGVDRSLLNFVSLDYNVSKELGGGLTEYLYPSKDVQASGGGVKGVLSLGLSASF